MNRSKFNIQIYGLMEKMLSPEYAKYLITKKYINFYKTQNLIFIHIPKAAGTSITKLIYGKRNGHLTARTVIDFLGQERFNDKTSFGVTRNPYDRLVSAYFYAIQGGSNVGAVSNSNLYKEKVFRSFESFVLEWLVKQDLNTVDPIFKPQYQYLFFEEKLLVQYVFKIESSDKLRDFLGNYLGKNNEMNVLNKSKRTKKFMEYYSKETVEVVNHLYSLDFKLLQYDKIEL